MDSTELSRLLQRNVVEWVRRRHGDPKWVRKLRKHASSHVVPTQGRGYLYTNGTKNRHLRGVTTWMKGLSRQRPSSPHHRRTMQQPPNPTIAIRGPLGALTGAERGTLVHRQVEDMVNLDRLSFRRAHRQGEHPWARDVHEAMVSGYHWRPVRAEFTVYSLRLNVATNIDLILTDRRGNIIVVELKTGYAAGAFDTNADNRAWSPAFLREAGVPKTPFGDALVQVVLGAELLRRRWRIPLSKLKLFVVRVDGGGVEFNQVKRSLFREIAPPLMARLKASAATKKLRKRS